MLQPALKKKGLRVGTLQSAKSRYLQPNLIRPSRYSTISSVRPNKFHLVDGVERLEKYEPGGYHPIIVDDVLHSRYRIVDKLGHGGYSTIWMAYDELSKRLAAVKVGISSTTNPQRDCRVLNTLSSEAPRQSYTTQVLEEFKVQGPNGLHPCLTLDPAQGNLKDASFSLLFPIKVARALAAKAALSLAFVHSRGFVHGDIHLRNMLMKQPPALFQNSGEAFKEQHGDPETVPVTRVDNLPLTANVPPHVMLPIILGKEAPDFAPDDAQDLILSDFGEAFSPSTETRLGRECNTPASSRAPEAFFEPMQPLSYPSDVWSLGLAIWDILGMKFLFSQETYDHNEIEAQQIDVLGLKRLPPAWRKAWERPIEDIDYDGDIPSQTRLSLEYGHRESWPTLEDAFEGFVQKYRRDDGRFGVFDEQETQEVLNLVRGMLEFRPEKRLTMSDVLKSRWMTERALPALCASESS